MLLSNYCRCLDASICVKYMHREGRRKKTQLNLSSENIERQQQNTQGRDDADACPHPAAEEASWHWLHSESPERWWLLLWPGRRPAGGFWSAPPSSWSSECEPLAAAPCTRPAVPSDALGRHKRSLQWWMANTGARTPPCKHQVNSAALIWKRCFKTAAKLPERSHRWSKARLSLWAATSQHTTLNWDQNDVFMHIFFNTIILCLKEFNTSTNRLGKRNAIRTYKHTDTQSGSEWIIEWAKTSISQTRSDPFSSLLSKLPPTGINFAVNGDCKSFCSNLESLLTGQ